MRLILWIVLTVCLAACGGANTPAGNQPAGCTGSTEPATAADARDAYVKAMGTMDALAITRLLTKADREKTGPEFEKLKDEVDKIVITETSFEQKGAYWVFTYSQVAHMKGGKTDGDDRKIVYILQEDGKWRISFSEPK